MKKPTLLGIGLMMALVAGATGFYLQQRLSGMADTPRQVVDNRSPGFDDQSLLGQPRPEFTLPDKGGQMRHVSEWDDRVLVINFWATWCPPCRDEIPGFIKLQEKYTARGLQFVGIALQDAEEVQDFVAEMGMNYPVLVGMEEVIKVSEQYGNQVGALPFTVIVDREQRIAFIKFGPLPYEEAENAILAVL